MIAASLADGYTTERMLDEGHYERNPTLGKHPSETTMVAYFSLSTGFKLLLAHLIPEYREVILYGFAFVNGYCAHHNVRLIRNNEGSQNHDTRYRYEISVEGR